MKSYWNLEFHNTLPIVDGTVPFVLLYVNPFFVYLCRALPNHLWNALNENIEHRFSPFSAGECTAKLPPFVQRDIHLSITNPGCKTNKNLQMKITILPLPTLEAQRWKRRVHHLDREGAAMSWRVFFSGRGIRAPKLEQIRWGFVPLRADAPAAGQWCNKNQKHVRHEKKPPLIFVASWF